MELPKEILEIFQKFTDSNYQLYLVGGSVRDLLMGKNPKDWDFTTDAKPEEILKLFPDGFYNNKFGTVGTPISSTSSLDNSSTQDNETTSQLDNEIIEITTMRKEGDYKDHRHPTEISWTDKIKEDLARRDFTINAIALSVKSVDQWASKTSTDLPTHQPTDNTELVDPFNGQTDLQKKLIKAVGDPNQRFQEDALRLMRAIRFSAQLGFEIEETTYQAIKQNAELIKQIAFERIRDELFKLLGSPNAYDGLLKLRDTGLFQIILPELEKCFGLVQEGPKHDRIYDIGDHSFRTMRETPSNDPVVKFAALLHDVGKGDTYKKDPQSGNVTFYNHDIVGAKIAEQICRRFNLSNHQSDKVIRLIRWHMFSTNETQTDSAIRRFIKNVGLENLEDMFALRIGDRLGGDTRKPVSWRMEEFQKRIKQVLEKPFSITDLKINGQDVMETLNIPPGPKVGQVLQTLFEEVQKDADKNNREYLLSRIKGL